MASAKREKLYPTPKECYDRDHERRQEGAPHRADPFYRAPKRPLESGLSSDAGHGYSIHQVVTYTEDEPIAATLAEDGRPRWQPGMELRICGRETPVARDWITPSQVAELLELSDPRVYQLVREGTIPAYRPGGEHGRARIHVSVLVSYCKRNGYLPEQVERIEALATAMTKEAC